VPLVVPTLPSAVEAAQAQTEMDAQATAAMNWVYQVQAQGTADALSYQATVTAQVMVAEVLPTATTRAVPPVPKVPTMGILDEPVIRWELPTPYIPVILKDPLDPPTPVPTFTPQYTPAPPPSNEVNVSKGDQIAPMREALP
jgi:hypothetical protein